MGPDSLEKVEEDMELPLLRGSAGQYWIQTARPFKAPMMGKQMILHPDFCRGMLVAFGEDLKDQEEASWAEI